ncbi:unnamed protein product [Parnassius apollo]|uniref:(apollo) hypothetical protein n=1 Tax=Parnassius apollo TaxID=110799 RepID=A0A8S3X8N7_PARAO|nr:unnamed protein product [Parnassius apollo]
MVEYIENRRKQNSNYEKVKVKCDGIDLLFLGYADSFKKLSKRTQVNVKFDIAKILMEAELNDLENAERNTSSLTSNYSNDMTIHAPATPGTHWGSNTSSHTTTYSSKHAPITQNDSEAAHQDSYDSNTTNIHALVTPGNYSLISNDSNTAEPTDLSTSTYFSQFASL